MKEKQELDVSKAHKNKVFGGKKKLKIGDTIKIPKKNPEGETEQKDFKIVSIIQLANGAHVIRALEVSE